MRLAAGRLRHRITIESQSTVSDGQGGNTATWGTLATVWAAISATGGREFQAARQSRPTLSHEITMRHRSDVTPAMRVKLSASRVFGIVAVIDPDETRTATVLHCEELVGEAA